MHWNRVVKPDNYEINELETSVLVTQLKLVTLCLKITWIGVFLKTQGTSGKRCSSLKDKNVGDDF